MTSHSFIGILMASAIIGHSNGLARNQHCDDEFMCLQKPDEYHTFQDNIDKQLKKNKELIDITNYEFDMEERTDGDDQNCWAETEVKTPYVIKTNASAEYVVQSEHFEQKIKTTQCKKASVPCLEKVTSVVSSLEATCEHKLGTISLYIYDPKQNRIRYFDFDLPVCCVCQTRAVYNKK